MALLPAETGSGIGSFLPLHAALSMGSDDARSSAIAAMARYVADDLTRNHPDLGRTGAVCPYAGGAVRRGLVRIGASPLSSLEATGVRRDIAAVRAAYDALVAGTPERDRIYCAVIVVFPCLPTGGAVLIERMQRAAKPDFVADGLMIGEFYPGCEARGLHSARFRPFDTPVTALAVRAMTAQDAPFMAGDPALVESFERRFGALRPAASQRAVAEDG